MRRRDAVAICIALAAMPTRAQTSAEPPLVVWFGFASEAGDRASLAVFRARLAELGRIDGRTIRIDAIHLAGRAELAAATIAAAEARRPAIFVAPGESAARALKRATTRPIVAMRLPESAPELFASLARPGGNLTGFSGFGSDIWAKGLELLREILPGLDTIGVLHDPGGVQFAYFQAAARAHGWRVVPLALDSNSVERLRQLLAGLRPAGTRALVTIDYRGYTMRDEIARMALEEGLVMAAPERESVEAGALLSYNADDVEQFRGGAEYVDRVLKGEKPADLPIQNATKLRLVVNLKTARALGLTLPPTVMLRADEVIE